jgi:regulator of sigma E protease
MSFLAIVVFVLIFSLLVLVHEAGHFMAARKAGVKVEEFGLGLPPRIWGKRKHGTIWSINWIPFGGFVRLKGEDGGHIQDKDSMAKKNSSQRLLIIVAGVLMNFLLAYVLLMVGFWGGMSPLAANLKALDGSQFTSRVVILDVVKNSTAAQAGVKAGDVVVSINGQTIRLATEFQQQTAKNSEVQLVLDRKGEQVKLSVPTKLDGDRRMIGTLIDEVTSNVSYTWWKVPYLALLDFTILLKQIGTALIGFIVHLFATASIQESVSGPVGIARVTNEAVKLGWTYILQLIIFLSVNLGLLNIIPFPALDGGRLFFVLLEMVRGGKKISKEWENGIHSLGFLLLLALIFAVTYRDVVNLFHPA